MLARLRNQEDEGFTLIELLVVIIIIGILAAIAIPIFLSQRKQATQASEKADLRTIALAMDTYFVDNQTYPTWSTGTPGQVTIGSAVVSLSKGNNAEVSTAPADVGVTGGYCARVWNTGIGETSATAVYYNSTRGGVQPKGTGICGLG